MRGLWLHARARRAQVVVVALAVLALLAARCGAWLATRTYFAGPEARPPVVALAPLVGALLVLTTLAGADTSLERSAPRLTARWRFAHGLIAAVIVIGGLAVTVLPHPWVFGAGAVARNSAGFVGIVLLSVVALPARGAWAPAFGYGVVIYLAAPRPPKGGAQWWAWLMAPGLPQLEALSYVVASLLLVAGLLAYALRGPSPAPTDLA